MKVIDAEMCVFRDNGVIRFALFLNKKCECHAKKMDLYSLTVFPLGMARWG